jgi:hypothetical protein
VVDEMQVEFNAATILGYVLTALVGVIAWMMRMAVSKLSEKIESLEEEDKRLGGEIHRIELKSVTKDDLKDLRLEMNKNFERVFDQLKSLEGKK